MEGLDNSGLCDNTAVVNTLNSITSKDKEVMHLLRCLAFITAKFQFIIMASHLPGQLNTAADALSRNRVIVFNAAGGRTTIRDPNGAT